MTYVDMAAVEKVNLKNSLQRLLMNNSQSLGNTYIESYLAAQFNVSIKAKVLI